MKEMFVFATAAKSFNHHGSIPQNSKHFYHYFIFHNSIKSFFSVFTHFVPKAKYLSLTQKLHKMGHFGTGSAAMCDLVSKNAMRFSREYERKISVSKLKNLEGLKIDCVS